MPTLDELRRRFAVRKDAPGDQPGEEEADAPGGGFLRRRGDLVGPPTSPSTPGEEEQEEATEGLPLADVFAVEEGGVGEIRMEPRATGFSKVDPVKVAARRLGRFPPRHVNCKCDPSPTRWQKIPGSVEYDRKADKYHGMPPDGILLFGRYKSKKVSELVVAGPVERDYLRWILREDFDDELKKVIQFLMDEYGYKVRK